MSVRPLLRLILAAGLVASSAAAQLTNPNFDAGSTGWTLVGGDGVSTVWDGTQGSPSPGSVKIEIGSTPGSPRAGSFRQCFGAASPGSQWEIRYQAWANLQSGDNCFPSIYFYEYPNCAGNSLPSPVPPAELNTGGWVTRSRVLTAPEGAVSASAGAVCLFQLVFLSPDAESLGVASTYRVDSVEVSRVPIFEQDFDAYPPDWSAIQPATCSGFCFPEGTPNGSCYCDDVCLFKDDCCLDACATCGECPVL